MAPGVGWGRLQVQVFTLMIYMSSLSPRVRCDPGLLVHETSLPRDRPTRVSGWSYWNPIPSSCSPLPLSTGTCDNLPLSVKYFPLKITLFKYKE